MDGKQCRGIFNGSSKLGKEKLNICTTVEVQIQARSVVAGAMQ